MVTLPVATPVTTPVLLMVAIVLLLLIHVPPAALLDKVILAATQTLTGPVIVPAEAGKPTVRVWVAMDVPQLLVTVYCMVSTPALIPPATPVERTMAVPLVALHVPPLPVVVSGVPEPIHTVPEPEIVPAPGKGLTVTAVVAATVPQTEVTE